MTKNSLKQLSKLLQNYYLNVTRESVISDCSGIQANNYLARKHTSI